MVKHIRSYCMRIGELAARSGLTHHTIRYYTSLGLLKAVAPAWNASNTYKDYPEENLDRLELIHLGQRLGFTLTQIAAQLDNILAARSQPAEIQALLQAQLARVQAQMAQLQETHDYLQAKLAYYEGRGAYPPPFLPIRPQVAAAFQQLHVAQQARVEET